MPADGGVGLGAQQQERAREGIIARASEKLQKFREAIQALFKKEGSDRINKKDTSRIDQILAIAEDDVARFKKEGAPLERILEEAKAGLAGVTLKEDLNRAVEGLKKKQKDNVEKALKEYREALVEVLKEGENAQVSTAEQVPEVATAEPVPAQASKPQANGASNAVEGLRADSVGTPPKEKRPARSQKGRASEHWIDDFIKSISRDFSDDQAFTAEILALEQPTNHQAEYKKLVAMAMEADHQRETFSAQNAEYYEKLMADLKIAFEEYLALQEAPPVPASAIPNATDTTPAPASPEPKKDFLAQAQAEIAERQQKRAAEEAAAAQKIADLRESKRAAEQKEVIALRTVIDQIRRFEVQRAEENIRRLNGSVVSTDIALTAVWEKMKDEGVQIQTARLLQGYLQGRVDKRFVQDDYAPVKEQIEQTIQAGVSIFSKESVLEVARGYGFESEAAILTRAAVPLPAENDKSSKGFGSAPAEAKRDEGKAIRLKQIESRFIAIDRLLGSYKGTPAEKSEGAQKLMEEKMELQRERAQLQAELGSSPSVSGAALEPDVPSIKEKTKEVLSPLQESLRDNEDRLIRFKGAIAGWKDTTPIDGVIGGWVTWLEAVIEAQKALEKATTPEERTARVKNVEAAIVIRPAESEAKKIQEWIKTHRSGASEKQEYIASVVEPRADAFALVSGFKAQKLTELLRAEQPVSVPNPDASDDPVVDISYRDGEYEGGVIVSAEEMNAKKEKTVKEFLEDLFSDKAFLDRLRVITNKEFFAGLTVLQQNKSMPGVAQKATEAALKLGGAIERASETLMQHSSFRHLLESVFAGVVADVAVSDSKDQRKYWGERTKAYIGMRLEDIDKQTGLTIKQLIQRFAILEWRTQFFPKKEDGIEIIDLAPDDPEVEISNEKEEVETRVAEGPMVTVEQADLKTQTEAARAQLEDIKAIIGSWDTKENLVHDDKLIKEAVKRFEEIVAHDEAFLAKGDVDGAYKDKRRRLTKGGYLERLQERLFEVISKDEPVYAERFSAWIKKEEAKPEKERNNAWIEQLQKRQAAVQALKPLFEAFLKPTSQPTPDAKPAPTPNTPPAPDATPATDASAAPISADAIPPTPDVKTSAPTPDVAAPVPPAAPPSAPDAIPPAPPTPDKANARPEPGFANEALFSAADRATILTWLKAQQPRIDRAQKLRVDKDLEEARKRYEPFGLNLARLESIVNATARLTEAKTDKERMDREAVLMSLREGGVILGAEAALSEIKAERRQLKGDAQYFEDNTPYSGQFQRSKSEIKARLKQIDAEMELMEMNVELEQALMEMVIVKTTKEDPGKFKNEIAEGEARVEQKDTSWKEVADTASQAHEELRARMETRKRDTEAEPYFGGIFQAVLKEQEVTIGLGKALRRFDILDKTELQITQALRLLDNAPSSPITPEQWNALPSAARSVLKRSGESENSTGENIKGRLYEILRSLTNDKSKANKDLQDQLGLVNGMKEQSAYALAQKAYQKLQADQKQAAQEVRRLTGDIETYNPLKVTKMADKNRYVEKLKEVNGRLELAKNQQRHIEALLKDGEAVLGISGRTLWGQYQKKGGEVIDQGGAYEALKNQQEVTKLVVQVIDGQDRLARLRLAEAPREDEIRKALPVLSVKGGGASFGKGMPAPKNPTSGGGGEKEKSVWESFKETGLYKGAAQFVEALTFWK